MVQTFYFYDLETSGFNARTARIMQFAGQRTDKNLKPIGEPDNILVKLTEDILPEPDAVLVHGISPRITQSQGITEPELLKYLTSKVFKPDTVAVGFNNIRFDDEFIRFTLWRNFYDAYEWQWKDGRGKWDMLDVTRMMRALRPEGIQWPFAPDGTPSNSLGLLSSVNKISHDAIHDALSDVRATIALAQLIRSKQPKLFDYLSKIRAKKEVEELVAGGQPFVYVSGRYPSEFEKATVAVLVASQPDRPAALVYDLRIDPTNFINMSPAELAKLWQNRDRDAPYFPIKVLAYNKCPTVAPLNVLDKDSQERLKLDMPTVDNNLVKLLKAKDFGGKLAKVLETVQPKIQPELVVDPQKVDELLYDGFINEPSDKTKMTAVRTATPEQLAKFKPTFNDDRLKVLLPLYKARNFPSSLTAEEKQWWQKYREQKLVVSGVADGYHQRIDELLKQPYLQPEHKNLLKELEAYAHSVVPKT